MTDSQHPPEMYTATAESRNRRSAIQERAAFARERFEHDLHVFVNRWGPTGHTLERDNFQRDLMMLFRDAMEYKSHVFGLHIERTEATLDALSMHATAPLQAIFKEPQRARDVTDQILDRPKKET